MHRWLGSASASVLNCRALTAKAEPYPAVTLRTAHVRRCVSMLAHLYHAEEVCGTATVGSSEAILLGGLAMKRRWQARGPENSPDH